MFLHYLFHLRSCAASAACGGSGPSPTSNGICCDLMSSYPGFAVNIVLQVSMLLLSLAFWHLVNGYMLDIHFIWWCRPLTIAVICSTMIAMQIFAARDAEHLYHSVATAAFAYWLIPCYMLVFPEAAPEPIDPQRLQPKVPYKGTAQQKDGFLEVVMKMPKDGKIVAKVPNGELLTVLEVDGAAGANRQGRVIWNETEGWVKLCNVVSAEPADEARLEAITPVDDPMAEFDGMNLKQCKAKARAEGIGQEEIDAADDAQDPRDAVARVQWQNTADDGQWQDLSQNDSDALEASWQDCCSGDQTINLVRNFPYIVNLGMMTMTNPNTKNVRKLQRCAPDPRWDAAGFKKFLSFAPAIQVGYFRERFSAGLQVQRHQDIADRFFCWGAWTPGTRLYKIEYLWRGRDHPDPSGLQLAKLVEYLDEFPRAENTDLIIDAGSFTCSPQRPCTIEQEKIRQRYMRDCSAAYTFAGLINIYLFDEPADHLGRIWFRLGLCTSLFCQRTKNAQDPLVKKLLSLETVMNFPQDVRDGLLKGNDKISSSMALEIHAGLAQQMSTVADDVDGFRFFCEQTRLAWVKVGYLQELVAKGGLCPRRQELPERAYFIGYPAEHLNIFVASHGWETFRHPSPNGNQFKVLVGTLSSKGASEDDLCFFDFMSLPQDLDMPRLYWSRIGLRTPDQITAFSYALHDMSRLYSFRRSRVVVIPNICKLDELPESRADWSRTYMHDDTSGHNDTAYHRRGWCVSEYSIARYYGRIINMENPLVQEIDKMHQWPTTIREYDELMKKETQGEPFVRFTNRGDIAAVRLIFFRFTSSLVAEQP